MSWDYRIIRTHDGSDEVFSIHEVFYGDKSRPMWTENPAKVTSESVRGVREQIEMMAKAFDRPIFEVVGDALVEWKPK